MTNLEAHIILNLIKGIGPANYTFLLKKFGTAEQILSAPENLLCQSPGISPRIAHSIATWQEQIDINQELEKIHSSGCHVVLLQDEEYPSLLKKITHPPFLLYVKGKILPQDHNGIALVGSRLTSFYGMETARKFARQLAYAGITVISGGAKGIDTAAHQGALQAGGRTLAILGNGINRIYPEENRPLFEEILRKGGALISQFPINLPGDRKTYPIRNRTIAGISLGTVVIEAPQISGALITAGMALEMNREVFAVPGRIDSPLSAGCHKLIKEGAKLCENIQDILNEFQIFTNLEQIDSQEDTNKKRTAFSQKSPTSPPHNNHPSPKKKQHQQPANLSLFQSQLPLPIRETNFLPLKLSPEETLLMEILTCQPQHIDELIRLSSLPSQKVQATLCSLELKKQVLQLPGKLYQKNSR